MQLEIKHGLPFVTVRLSCRGASIDVSDVLVDTGSGSTTFAADTVALLGIRPELDDVVSTIRGVGGREVVYRRRIEAVELGDHSLRDWVIEVAAMDYGFQIAGILGMDLLSNLGAVINFDALTIQFALPGSDLRLIDTD